MIFGVSTNQVVEATARHADDLGLIVTVLDDCSASANEELHRFATEKILPIFGNVVPSEQFLNSLEISVNPLNYDLNKPIVLRNIRIVDLIYV